MAFQFDPPDVGLETAVFQAIGAASMCWENGVFHSERAEEIGTALLAKINEVMG